VFIRHRTQEEIEEANDIDISTLRDPQSDAERVKKPEWLVMLGVCTHLGCVPIGKYISLRGYGANSRRIRRLWRVVLSLPRIPL
jgi:Rieske Fe-S protein